MRFRAGFEIWLLLLVFAAKLAAAEAVLPAGPGKEIVVSACSACHTLERIAALRLTEEGWRNTVRQMIEDGASFNPKDVDPIIAYLTKNFGAASSEASASKVNPPASPAASSSAPGPAPVGNPDPRAVSFNRDIQPIMSRTCFRCHGPDASSRMAGMRLDLRDEALKPKSKGTPIIPGDPANSEVVQRIFATDGRIMPPASAHKELTPAEKETIRRWIAEGARYEGHWAYQAITRPAVPTVKSPLVRNPIDAFIQAPLAQEALRPSPEADRRTLIRRVTLDLTGLAPETAQIDAFLRDKSPGAYDKVVDRLLSSPAYAEHQAVPWLDAVRYADSAGYHSDGERPAWPYRDYVLRAFLENKPFDQFTREQLAGDLLPNATPEQRVASAYNRMGRTSAEGGLQPKEYWAKYGADRVRALGANWLGSTLGCAECHDHKFDPILSKDFYALKAFFADIKEEGLVPDTGPGAFAPKMPVYRPGEQEKIEELTRRIAAEQAEMDARADRMKDDRRRLERILLDRPADTAWKFQIPASVSAREAQLTVDAQGTSPADFAATQPAFRSGPGTVLAGGPNPDNETYTVMVKPGAGQWSYLAIEVGSDLRLAGANVSRGSDRFILTEVTAEYSADGQRAAVPAQFSLAYSASAPTTGFPAPAAIDGDSNTGWGFVGNAGRPFLVLRFVEPIVTEANSTITVRLHHDSDYRRAVLGKFRIGVSSDSALPDVPPPPSQTQQVETPKESQLQQALKAAEDQRSEAQAGLIRTYLEYSSPDLFPARLALSQLEMALSLMQGSVAQVMVTEAVEPKETRLLPRGNWMDDSGPLLEPAIPEFLGKIDTGNRRATRLDLANWLVSPENPLTARVFVNRLWRQFFGTGLSRTIDDAGSQGEWPSHSELLDWMAAEFMSGADKSATHGWDIRHLIRTIVTSHTYRQSSLSRPELDQRDPDNRLLARQSRFRVDAEAVRDLALQISGLLVNQFGGPPVRPYQPDGYLAALNFPKRDWSAGHGDQLYRRALYTMWQRTFLHPSLANFDAPSREEANVNRVNSNTPLQALDLMNDPIFVEASRAFGQKILQNGGTRVRDQIKWAFREATGREPDAKEIAVLMNLHRESAAQFQTDPGSAQKLLKTGESPVPGNERPTELAAITNVARAILNLHEVITRD